MRMRILMVLAVMLMSMTGAMAQQVVVDNVTYKVGSDGDAYVSVIANDAAVKDVVIKSSVNIDGKEYKVTVVGGSG